MKLLAIDTSGTALSAAIAEESGADVRIVGSFGLNTGLNHSVELLPKLQELLQEKQLQLADMDAFAVTIGPGSFTGLRIGCATVKAWAHALAKPLISVSSLQACAKSVAEKGLICPLFDARRNEVYTALFENGKRLWQDMACSPEDLAEKLHALNRPVVPAGGGWLSYGILLQELLPGLFLPQEQSIERSLYLAEAAALLAAEKFRQQDFTAPQELLPTYLRLSEAEEKLQQREKEAADE